MKLQHLRFFTAVVECGGVIKAAERLHVSQPAVSAGLKTLEEELGGNLFDRGTGRKLTLTPAGRQFLRQAQEILKRCESAKANFAAGEERRLVRIGVLDTLPEAVVIALLERLALRRPEWQVVFWEGSVQRLTGWLGQGRIDIALTNVHGNRNGERVVWQEPLVAVIAPGHRFEARAEHGVELGDLAKEPFLHRSRCELDALGRAQLRAAGVTLQVTMRGERDSLVFALVRAGKAFTLAPRSLVPAGLTAVPVNGLAVNRAVGLQWTGETDADLVETITEELLGIVGDEG